MPEIVPNPWALLGCVAIRMAVGALWYSPVLFLKPWLRLSGVTDAQMKSGFGKAIVTDLVLSAIMAFVLLHAIRYALPTSHAFSLGMAVAFLNWLGFIVPAQAAALTYEKKPLGYFAINSGYQLVTLLLMGVVLILWD
jgi:hypothetical protein